MVKKREKEKILSMLSHQITLMNLLYFKFRLNFQLKTTISLVWEDERIE